MLSAVFSIDYAFVTAFQSYLTVVRKIAKKGSKKGKNANYLAKKLYIETLTLQFCLRCVEH